MLRMKASLGYLLSTERHANHCLVSCCPYGETWQSNKTLQVRIWCSWIKCKWRPMETQQAQATADHSFLCDTILYSTSMYPWVYIGVVGYREAIVCSLLYPSVNCLIGWRTSYASLKTTAGSFIDLFIASPVLVECIITTMLEKAEKSGKCSDTRQYLSQLQYPQHGAFLVVIETSSPTVFSTLSQHSFVSARRYLVHTAHLFHTTTPPTDTVEVALSNDVTSQLRSRRCNVEQTDTLQ